MKVLKFILLLFFLSSPVFADIDVKVNSTIIKDETIFTIKNQKQSIEKNEYQAIIHNKYASSAKQVTIFYDDFIEVKNAEVSIHSIDGKRIKKIKLKDFEDYGVGLSNTASDSRVKYYEPNISTYPFIIKVSYELHKSGSLHYPVWKPQQEENMKVKKASFIVQDYSGNGIQYKMHQLTEPTIGNKDGAKIYKWQLEDLEAFEFEHYNNSWEDYTAVLYTAPKHFEMDGIAGDMSSWNAFGKWIAKLNSEKDDISELDLTELDNRLKNVDSKLEKIRMVYDYLQNNTRYVSIQLGIGGWQPFEASFVHQKKYGDCKALSNYTKALLERYDVYSYYTLIRAGKYQHGVEEDFPNAHFNHAIVTVPLEQDTIFLECTSQTNPFGYMGTFTSNRNALMITPEGGKLISTKKYQPGENIQSTNIEVDLSNKQITNIIFERNYKGLEIDNHNFQRLYSKDSNELNKWVRKNHDWGGQKLANIELIDLKEDKLPEAGYKVEFASNSEYVNMGKRKFISADRYVNSFISSLPNKERKTSIKIKYGYTQYDTIRYRLDKFHLLEKDLAKLEFESEYGQYHRELIKKGEELYYIRKFQLNDGEYPVEKYQDFREFVQKVKSADKERFVLLDKT